MRISKQWKPATRDGLCCNGDGRPVSPPSRVLCAECGAELNEKMEKLLGGTNRAEGGTP